MREYWSYCGEIESLSLMRFPDTNRFKGIAFITFATVASSPRACCCVACSTPCCRVACTGSLLLCCLYRLVLPCCLCRLLLCCLYMRLQLYLPGLWVLMMSAFGAFTK